MCIQNNKNIVKQLFYVFLFTLFTFSNSYAAKHTYDQEMDHPPISILDEQGTHVILSKKPYSPKKTCEGSGCHDYNGITHAYHFEMGRDETDDNYGLKRGLPQLVSPGYYGGYSCMGGSNPLILAKKNNNSPNEFADQGSAGFLKNCLDCHTGGGWAEKDRDGIRYDQKNIASIKPLDGDYYDRVTNPQTRHETIEPWDWKKSGVAEADCLFCHLKYSKLKLPADSGLSQPLSPRQARRAFAKQGFFRQTASAIMEYVKNKEGVNLLSIARSEGKFTLDNLGQPIMNWHAEAFSETGKVNLSMLRFPESENCMECHLTSNSRRGFYGFGEDARATLESASEGEGETQGAGSDFVDDYKDDIHKGTNYIADNGEKRTIESCNACHSALYYKSIFSNVALNANHNFPKGNSDMDVRNDLDFRPNVKTCEKCHINSINAVKGAEATLLKTHTEAWKASGDLKGYDPVSLTSITQRHFDTVACQTCHITNKTDKNEDELQIMYRYRVAEDGLSKISPYNPRLRYYWKDKTSGRVLYQKERNSVFIKSGNNKEIADIIDPISNEILGQVTNIDGNHGFIDNAPRSYENYIALKTAYDSLLRKKGYTNPNTSMVWTESNEYIISHNTRLKEDSIPCKDCHTANQSGGYSQFISPAGVLGESNIKIVANIPDNRLISEGVVTLGMPYNRIQANGEITQNVADILYETKIDPFMSLLKNSSAKEITGEFIEIKTTDLLASVGTELGGLLAPDFIDATSFFFTLNKGDINLRNMAVAISGNGINNVLLPTFRTALGIVEGGEAIIQNILNERNYGQLRSRVFYLDVLDSSKSQVVSFNDVPMFVKVAYKGIQTDLNKVNIITADSAVTRIMNLPASDLVMLKPANEIDDGFVIFKMRETGYFLVADK